MTSTDFNRISPLSIQHLINICIYIYHGVMKLLSVDKRRKVARECVHYNLKRAVRIATQRYDESLKPTGLHITQFTLLVSISLLAPAGISDVAENLSLDQTTLSRNLQPLLKQGFIKLEPSPSDNRTRLITLTERGESVISEAYPKWLEAQNSVIETLGQNSYKQLLKATAAIAGEEKYEN
jgi:DNA-binding MarR family transcriptional regulator